MKEVHMDKKLKELSERKLKITLVLVMLFIITGIKNIAVAFSNGDSYVGIQLTYGIRWFCLIGGSIMTIISLVVLIASLKEFFDNHKKEGEK
jgi:TRAP-type C4-dicarboxylate transport system permease small subunit